MDKSFWKETVRKNADKKNMGLCNRSKERVYTEEGKSLSAVKRRERGGKRVHQRAVVKRIHPAIKVTTNGAGILCRKKGWEEANGVGLPIFE